MHAWQEARDLNDSIRFPAYHHDAIRSPPPHHSGGGANLSLQSVTRDSIHCLTSLLTLRFAAAVSYVRVPSSALHSRLWPTTLLQLQRPRRQTHPKSRQLPDKLNLHNQRLVLCPLETATVNAATAVLEQGHHQELHLRLETIKLLAGNIRAPNGIAAWWMGMLWRNP